MNNNPERFLEVLDQEDGIALIQQLDSIYRRNPLEGMEMENMILRELTTKKQLNIQIEGNHYLLQRIKRILDIDENMVSYIVKAYFINNLN